MARTLRSDRTANRKDGHKDTTKRKQSKSKSNRPTVLRANGFGAVGCRCVLSKHP